MTCPACRRDNCPTMAEAENTDAIVAGALDCQLARNPLPAYERQRIEYPADPAEAFLTPGVDPTGIVLMNQTVESLNFSPRTQNALLNLGVRSLGQLLLCSESDLAQRQSFGRRTMAELKSKLADMGLGLTA